MSAVVGGQDGLDIINTTKLANNSKEEKPVFSGLVIYNDLIESGHEYEGWRDTRRRLFVTVRNCI